ncbi:isochorismate synthase [Egbenema bharatensis]|uniref:isochorismate synthase n=1 Tax=Egbenema bharatensis TaxID=3463334 RepID=UPI003A8BEF40
MLCQSQFKSLDFFQDRKKLYQFLDFCRQKSIAECHPKIVSISLEIDAIDPLIALYNLVQPDQCHFYFENRECDRAIAAIGAVRSVQLHGAQRFSRAQLFIQDCLNHLISNHSSEYVVAPQFFCSFTFFDQAVESHQPFPPATIFLPQWQISCWQSECVVITNLIVDSDTEIDHLSETIWQEFQAIQRQQYHPFLFSSPLQPIFNWEINNPHDFQKTVISALESIQRRQLEKLVLANAVDVVSPLPFQWGHSLHNLRQVYPDCYVFSVSNGKGQYFIGASPERLLSVQNQRLVTDALAGSAPRGRSREEDDALAKRLLESDKERREHQVVVDFITQQLAQFGLKIHLANEPTLLRLSNIQHLHTPMRTTLPNTIHPLELLAQLHPTPAVAGLPRDIACEQIRHYESFCRSLYAAPLGWVDAQGNAEFIVGIRSALLDGHCARLYAGAGIVAGSDPQREMAEVQLKLQALLRALV